MITLFFLTGVKLLQSSSDYTRPQEISYCDFLNRRPDNPWLIIKNCKLDLSAPAYHMGSSALIPIILPGKKWNREVRLLLETDDKEFLKALAGIKSNGSKGLFYNYPNSNKECLPVITIDGLVRLDLDKASEEKKRLHKSLKNLAADFSVIKHHDAPPSIWNGILLLILGAILTVLLILDLTTPPSPRNLFPYHKRVLIDSGAHFTAEIQPQKSYKVLAYSVSPGSYLINVKGEILNTVAIFSSMG
ncbi:MAG: hypothetical protein GY757_31130 [bacterium]|nr:hypothetical protein [bacterium]